MLRTSSSELITLLNSAASNNPNEVVLAGQQLQLITTPSDSNDRVFEKLASIVFSLHNDHLTTNGRFVGLVHLRHALFDFQSWNKLDASERHSVRDLLWNFLASGCDPLTLRNNIEVLPRIGSCITTFVACLVHSDWLREEWSDDIWKQLIHWCAWSSLRSSLRALAGYRLPARRKVFLGLIRSLFPALLGLWHTNSLNADATNLDSLIQLSRLLYTCLTSPALQLNRGPYLLNGDDVSVAEGVFERCFTILERLRSGVSDGCWSLKHAQFSRRITKLVFATFLASSPEVRGRSVKILLLNGINIILQQSSQPHLDQKALTWILAIVYGLLSSKAHEPDAHLSLDSYGSSELQKHLFLRSSVEGEDFNGRPSDTLIFTFLQNLVHTAFPLSPAEVLGITSDPEACMAAGGSCVSLAGESSSENVTSSAIWDVDMQAQNLIRIDLQSLFNNRGSEHPVQSCRQLTELIITQLLRHYGTDAKCVLFQLVLSMRCATSSPLQYETLVRLIQLVLPYTALDPDWCELSNWALSSASTFITSHLPVTDASEHAQQLVVLTTRVLCFLMRCIVYSVPAGVNQESRSSCTDLMSRLVPYLRAGATDGVQIGPPKMCLCVRLAAAHCVAWCIGQSVFPVEALVCHVQPLFHSLVQLIYDVSECETRVYLLGVVRGLLETTEMMNHPDLAEQMVGVLDQLWQLETSTTALRVSILDTVCLFQTTINQSEDHDTRLAQFRTALLSPVATLIVAALEEEGLHGSEALFEPGLRLWQSLINGPRASWSTAVACLLPILVGQQWNTEAIGDAKQTGLGAKPLIDRLDSSGQAELFFDIALAYLSLVDRTDPETRCGFLGQWTEPFWGTVLQATNSKLQPGDKMSALDYLCSSAALSGDDDTQQDSESVCRLKQLRLCATWLSMCLDSMGPENALTSSLVGLLVLGARNSLIKAPVDAHNDASPRATEMQLSLLARLAYRQEYWSHYLHILDILCANLTGQNLSNGSTYLPTVEGGSTDTSLLVKSALERWIVRADSLTESVDRRCCALACLQSLVYFAQPNQAQQAGGSLSNEELEHWALQDSLHAQWLEPVVNICIQVLFDETRPVLQSPTDVHAMHPVAMATDQGLRPAMLAAFNAWQNRLGGEQFADVLLRCHVDPALITQLRTQLNRDCSESS